MSDLPGSKSVSKPTTEDPTKTNTSSSDPNVNSTLNVNANDNSNVNVNSNIIQSNPDSNSNPNPKAELDPNPNSNPDPNSDPTFFTSIPLTSTASSTSLPSTKESSTHSSTSSPLTSLSSTTSTSTSSTSTSQSTTSGPTNSISNTSSSSAINTTLSSSPGSTTLATSTRSVSDPSQTQIDAGASSRSFFKHPAAVAGVFTVVGLICVAMIAAVAYYKIRRRRRFTEIDEDAEEGRVQGRWRHKITPFLSPVGTSGSQIVSGEEAASGLEYRAKRRLGGQERSEQSEAPPSYSGYSPPYGAGGPAVSPAASEVAMSEALASATLSSFGSDAEKATHSLSALALVSLL